MPDVPVLGEEEGGSDAATRWVVDPLDGTSNFMHHVPHFSIILAVQSRVLAVQAVAS